MGKKDELMSNLNNQAVPLEKQKPRYQYRKFGKGGRKKPMVTFTIDAELEDKIERDAYWNRHKFDNKSQLVNEILANYYRDKDFEPIPPKD